MKNVLMLLLFAFLASAAAPSGVAAQCGNQTSCFGGHKLPESQNGLWTGAHTYCGTCLYGWCHDACGPTEDLDEELALLESAIEMSDVDEIARIAVRLPGYVVLNEDRAAIQFAACGGRGIQYSVPISPGFFTEIDTAVQVLLDQQE